MTNFKNIKLVIGKIFCILLLTVLIAQLIGIKSVLADLPTTKPEVYDYYFMLDASGSMNEPASNSRFSQVQSSLVEMINQMEDGMNLYIYPFANENFAQPFERTNIDANDRQAAIEYVQSIKPTGSSTLLWDTAYTVLEKMKEQANDPEATHIQSLILFTDGEDTGSTKTQADCLSQFGNLTVSNADTYWLWYSLGGITTPNAINNQKGITVFQPDGLPIISVVHPKPLTLDLGNIFDQGSATKCFTMWYSNRNLIGQTVALGEPVLDTNSLDLPEGMAFDVSPRTFTISNQDVCLTIRIVNYDKTVFTDKDYGSDSFSIPFVVDTSNSKNVSKLVFQPDAIIVKFDFERPSPELFIHSASGSPIDLGQITRPELGQTSDKTVNFDLGWNNVLGDSYVTVQIVGDSSNPRVLAIPQEIGMAVNKGDYASTLKLSSDTRNFSFYISLADSAWKDLTPGSYKFSGKILFTPHNVSITGSDVENSTGEIPFTFTIVQSLTGLKIQTNGLEKTLNLGSITLNPKNTSSTWNLLWDKTAQGDEQVIAKIALSKENKNELTIPAEIGLTTDSVSTLSDQVVLTSQNSQLTLNLHLPNKIFYAWPANPQVYTGDIVLTPKNLTKIEDIGLLQNDGTSLLPFTFTVKVQPPTYLIILFFFVIGFILCLLLWIFLKPRWPADIDLYCDGKLVGTCKDYASSNQKLRIGKGDVDVVLNGATEEAIYITIYPTMRTCLLMHLFKADSEANYSVKIDESTDLDDSNRHRYSDSSVYNWMVEERIYIVRGTRTWMLELKQNNQQ